MASSTQLFYRLWQEETVRERFFELLSKQDICAVRVANSACCNLVTRRLFVRISLTFTPNTFTNPHRIQALSRIGHHIEHLSFTFPHSNATFLPPLIHPQTGQEILFLYNPHTSMASALTRPKYGNSELGDILTQQYPPLFHAASNVPSFINAMKHMINMRHLTIRTPGQEPSERYRRDIVDYALISLRISVERAPLTKLNKLTLSGVHPSSFNYLRHKPGFGALPSAALRWRQIKKLYISVESWDFYGPAPGLDHLKIIDDYIRDFAPELEKFSFTWLGRKGPCPIALSGDPLFAAPRHTRKLFNEVTSPMSPLPPRPQRHPLVMPKLRCLSVSNATMNAPQLKGLVASHRSTVREFDFDNVALIKGSWDDALGPLVDKEEGGSPGSWSRKSFASGSSKTRPGTPKANNTSTGSAVASSAEDEAVTPSSAAAEASRELFEVDLEGMVFGGVNDVDNSEAGVEEWARGVTAAAASASMTCDRLDEFDDDGLASDIEAAKKASEGYTTTLRKRRLRKKRRHHDLVEEDERRSERSAEKEKEKSTRHLPSLIKSSSKLALKHSRSRSDETSSTTTKDTKARDRSESRPRLQRRRRHHRHHSSDDVLPPLPTMPSMPEVVGSDDESYFNSQHPYYASPGPSTPPPLTRSNSLSSSHSASPSPAPSHARINRGSSRIEISVPILNPHPFPVLLQPTVYDPSAKTGPFVCSIVGEEQHGLYEDDGLSPAQRMIEADMLAEAQEREARSSALKRAREAVMTKLSREFSRKANANNEKNKGSAAVQQVAGMVSIADLPLHPLHTGADNSTNNVSGSSNSIGYRIREGLFGKSMANVAECRMDQQRVTVESNGSALVPLIFARS
ncbi:hypothetical protein QBC40DRAFT_277902 [Triangularia verruculosa]|uniref:Uncharacterized protein n=1 Tax=Triangularia verruculosa TaxID=2587418 RepID=A0AAN6XJ66_9PEZI|nr:hypothetical protein QBC40DRAFT_277902 [Triangularia verruculosa]